MAFKLMFVALLASTMAQPEAGLCGPKTHLENGQCVVDEANNATAPFVRTRDGAIEMGVNGALLTLTSGDGSGAGAQDADAFITVREEYLTNLVSVTVSDTVAGVTDSFATLVDTAISTSQQAMNAAEALEEDVRGVITSVESSISSAIETINDQVTESLEENVATVTRTVETFASSVEDCAAAGLLFNGDECTRPDAKVPAEGNCDAGNVGAMKFSADSHTLSICNGEEWDDFVSVGLGTSEDHPGSCDVLDDGLFWLKIGNGDPFQWYCEDGELVIGYDRQHPAGSCHHISSVTGIAWIRAWNGAITRYYCKDGWALAANIRKTNNQDHYNRGQVRTSLYPITPDSSATTKWDDATIRNYRRTSSYGSSGSNTPLLLEGWNFDRSSCPQAYDDALKMYFHHSCSNFDSQNSVMHYNRACSQHSFQFEGAQNVLSWFPNTGTRGLGHHHYNSRSFAWQRHPEQGNNRGVRSDDCGSGDGLLWVR